MNIIEWLLFLSFHYSFTWRSLQLGPKIRCISVLIPSWNQITLTKMDRIIDKVGQHRLSVLFFIQHTHTHTHTRMYLYYAFTSLFHIQTHLFIDTLCKRTFWKLGAFISLFLRPKYFFLFLFLIFVTYTPVFRIHLDIHTYIHTDR